MSKNRPSIEHLKMACRHVLELISAGVTENHAVRTLELFSDVYAKMHNGGSATPHHATQVPHAQWSVAAKQLISQNPNAKPRDFLRVEHGTPRREFARMVMKLYETGTLNENKMAILVNKYWKLAVITVEEDQILNNKFRSKLFSSPDERWAAANIVFDDPKT